MSLNHRPNHLVDQVWQAWINSLISLGTKITLAHKNHRSWPLVCWLVLNHGSSNNPDQAQFKLTRLRVSEEEGKEEKS